MNIPILLNIHIDNNTGSLLIELRYIVVGDIDYISYYFRVY